MPACQASPLLSRGANPSATPGVGNGTFQPTPLPRAEFCSATLRTLCPAAWTQSHVGGLSTLLCVAGRCSLPFVSLPLLRELELSGHHDYGYYCRPLENMCVHACRQPLYNNPQTKVTGPISPRPCTAHSLSCPSTTTPPPPSLGC